MDVERYLKILEEAKKIEKADVDLEKEFEEFFGIKPEIVEEDYVSARLQVPMERAKKIFEAFKVKPCLVGIAEHCNLFLKARKVNRPDTEWYVFIDDKDHLTCICACKVQNCIEFSIRLSC